MTIETGVVVPAAWHPIGSAARYGATGFVGRMEMSGW